MKDTTLLVTVFSSILFGGTMPSTTQEKSSQSLDALAEGSNKFAIALYQTLAKNSSGNLIVSPISLQLILALVYAGAKGRTAKEIQDALGLPDKLDDVLNGHKLLIQELGSQSVLKLATKMYLDNTFKVLQEFQDSATNYFSSTAQNVDFSHEPEPARKTINNWVEENTNNKIKDLLSEGSIDSVTRMVLVNAVHFKAKWMYTFDAEDTEEEPFYVTPTETVPVQMMHIKKKFGYKHHNDLQAKILDMPYKDNEFRMIIILPDAKDGLANVEAKLPTLNLATEFANLETATVNVALPRFKMEEKMDLKDILISMGMGSLFAQADLSGISKEPLVVSKAVQKAFIEVNEEGTEAAASTVVGVGRSGHALLNVYFFVADHPFLVILQQKEMNIPLFIGRLQNPS